MSAGKLHIPFVEWLCKRMQYEDMKLPHRLLVGFQFVGTIEASSVGAEPVDDGTWRPTAAELWENRQQTNAEILA